MDLLFRRFIPWPSLFGTDDSALHEEDVMNRRRAWYWAHKFRVAVWLGIVALGIYGVYLAIGGTALVHKIIPLVITLPFLLLTNFPIFFGPMVMMGILQIQAFEPGDADWGVKLQDVRGQPEAKEEVRRVVKLWQSGEAFESAGGERERGLLMLGAPGTGKTMLSKAIATGFNSPFVSIPGSGFAQTFIGMDAVIVRYLARKASGSRASGAASASSSSTRSTPSACGARASAAAHGMSTRRPDQRLLLLRAEGRAHADAATWSSRRGPGANGSSRSARRRRTRRTRRSSTGSAAPRTRCCRACSAAAAAGSRSTSCSS